MFCSENMANRWIPKVWEFFKAVIVKAELLHLCTRCIDPDTFLYIGSGYDTTKCAYNRVRLQQGAVTTGCGYNTGCAYNRVRLQCRVRAKLGVTSTGIGSFKTTFLLQILPETSQRQIENAIIQYLWVTKSGSILQFTLSKWHFHGLKKIRFPPLTGTQPVLFVTFFSRFLH